MGDPIGPVPRGLVSVVRLELAELRSSWPATEHRLWRNFLDIVG